MRILHVLDHSIPLHSGYTFRSAAILREQRALGWDTFHLTGPRQIKCRVAEEDVDGLHFFRTAPPAGLMSKLPVLNERLLNVLRFTIGCSTYSSTTRNAASDTTEMTVSQTMKSEENQLSCCPLSRTICRQPSPVVRRASPQ